MRRLFLALFVCGILAVPLARPLYAQSLSGSAAGDPNYVAPTADDSGDSQDTYQGEEQIDDFSVNATLAPDRTVTFDEQIKYDFGDQEKHGIYRYIPVSYDRNGATYKLRLNVTNVERDGNSEQYDQSTSDGNLNLKIGNPDVGDLTGPHAYEIVYNTNRAINFFPDHDELYWNVTGNGWEVPIDQSSFNLTLPTGIDMGAVSSTCFTGAYGSTEKACTITAQGNVLTFKTTRALDAEEGFTIVVGLPKGVITPPTTQDEINMFLSDNGALGFPLGAFLLMFAWWWFKGRDPKKGTIIPEYEAPQKLAPAVIGAAMTTGSIPGRATTATIIDLARRGYLKIKFGEKKGLLSTSQTFTFVKQAGGKGALTDFENDLYSGMFEIGDEQTIEGLKDDQFYEDVAKFRKHVQAVIDGMGLFDKNPGRVRAIYIFMGGAAGWILAYAIGSNALGITCAIATGIIIAGFGYLMPRRTPAGAKLLTDIDGFKWFLSVTEKDRLAFSDAPKRTPEQFMDLLPYAIVFEVEKKWAEQFASLNIPPPSWAEGSTTTGWNTALFVSNLGALHSAASSSAYASPSSSGGGGSGFSGGGSGGGGGGGGGGSW
ncbi:MAG: DUF2207 domain-containing protein [Patescibacteria group bacterium]